MYNVGYCCMKQRERCSGREFDSENRTIINKLIIGEINESLTPYSPKTYGWN